MYECGWVRENEFDVHGALDQGRQPRGAWWRQGHGPHREQHRPPHLGTMFRNAGKVHVLSQLRLYDRCPAVHAWWTCVLHVCPSVVHCFILDCNVKYGYLNDM